MILCITCRYCIDGCSKKILIPNLFAGMNANKQYHDWNSNHYYNQAHTQENGKASECFKCGKCEKVCPQHLGTRTLLEQIEETFKET